MSAAGIVRGLRQDLREEFVHAHGPAHLKQFAALFVGAFGTAVVAGGWHVAGVGAMGSLVVGAAGAAARQVWPQLPWRAAVRVLAHAEEVASRPAAVVSGIATPTLKAPDK